MSVRPVSRLARYLLSAALLGTSLTILGVTIWSAGRGFDLTDESFYLNWLEWPEDISSSTTVFGHVYQPLVVLTDLDVVRMRVVNILITTGLAALAAWAVLRRLSSQSPTSIFVLACGLSGLATLGLSLITPSYHSLAAQAFYMAVFGLARACGRTKSDLVAGAVTLGVAGCLAFLAKPTAAVALAVVVLAFCLIRGRMLAAASIAGITGLGSLAASAVVIDGSIRAFGERLRSGAEDSRLLEARHDLDSALRWDGITPTLVDAPVVAMVGAATFAMVTGSRFLRRLSSLALVAVCCACVVWLFLQPSVLDPGRPQRWLPLLTVPVVVALHRLGSRWPISRGRMAWVFLLLAVPHAYAFGSNSHYWTVAGALCLSWVLAGVVLLDDHPRVNPHGPLQLVMVTQLVGVLLLAGNLEHPYRQGTPIWAATEVVAVDGSSIRLTPEHAAFVIEVEALRRRVAIPVGTPMIDLSGMSPGLIRLLGGRPADRPWAIGGYPGSNAFEERALGRAPCNVLARAWLIVEAGGPRSLDPVVLESFGRTVEDYSVAGLLEDVPRSGTPGRKTVEVRRPDFDTDRAARTCLRRHEAHSDVAFERTRLSRMRFAG